MNNNKSILVFNSLSVAQNRVFDKISSIGSNGIHLFGISTIDQIQKKCARFSQDQTKVSLIVFIGEFLNLNSDQIKGTNFTIFDFIDKIRSLNFSCVHIDVPTYINSDQRSKMIEHLISFDRHFCISINRSQNNDIDSTLNFSLKVAEGCEPHKIISSYSQKFLVTSSSSVVNEPIFSVSSDEGLTFSQSFTFPVLTQKIVITEQSLGLSEDELSTFDSIVFVSDTQSIINLMGLPWENNLKGDSTTILHITVHLPFVNDGYTTYLELSNKSRVPMKFFEQLQTKANTNRRVRLFFPLIQSLNQKELKNDQVFVLNVKKHQKIVQQIMFSSMWTTWSKAIEQIHPKYYSHSSGEKIRLLNSLYEQNQVGVMCFTNLYSVVSDFQLDSLIPFHTSNTIVCEIYQASKAKKRTLEEILTDQDRINSFVVPSAPVPQCSTNHINQTNIHNSIIKQQPFIKIEPKVTNISKIEHKEHKKPKKQKIDDFFQQIKSAKSLSIKLN